MLTRANLAKGSHGTGSKIKCIKKNGGKKHPLTKKSIFLHKHVNTTKKIKGFNNLICEIKDEIVGIFTTN